MVGLFAYFRNENCKSKQNYKSYKDLSILLKTTDNFDNITTDSTSLTLSKTAFGL